MFEGEDEEGEHEEGEDEEGEDEEAEEDEDDEEIQLLVLSIRQALAEEQSQESIVDQILDGEDDKETRFNMTRLVSEVADTLSESDYSEQVESSGASGWMMWIGLLVFVNILSAALDWGFWVY